MTADTAAWEARLAEIEPALRLVLGTLQAERERLSKLCRDEKPHNHSTLRILGEAIEKLDAIHATILEAHSRASAQEPWYPRLHREIDFEFDASGQQTALLLKQPKDGGPTERTWPCIECGAPRTRAEGGYVFTRCDECWEKKFGKAAVISTAQPKGEAQE